MTTTDTIEMDDEGTTTAYVVEHRGRYWLARYSDDAGRWYGTLDERTAREGGCSARYGSLDYVCSRGVQSWASAGGARRALTAGPDAVDEVRVYR